MAGCWVSLLRAFTVVGPVLLAAIPSPPIVAALGPASQTVSGGSRFETRAPVAALRGDRPNPSLLEARFGLRPPGVPATGNSAAHARPDPQTLLHYQLYGPPGSRPPPRLESYPFPLLGRGVVVGRIQRQSGHVGRAPDSGRPLPVVVAAPPAPRVST